MAPADATRIKTTANMPGVLKEPKSGPALAAKRARTIAAVKKAVQTAVVAAERPKSAGSTAQESSDGVQTDDAPMEHNEEDNGESSGESFGESWMEVTNKNS